MVIYKLLWWLSHWIFRSKRGTAGALSVTQVCGSRNDFLVDCFKNILDVWASVKLNTLEF